MRFPQTGIDDEFYGLVDAITARELREDAVEPPTCGVYVLFRGTEIVYIGRSINLMARIGRHVQDDTKEFNSYTIIETTPQQARVLESELIERFRPRFNKALVPDVELPFPSEPSEPAVRAEMPVVLEALYRLAPRPERLVDTKEAAKRAGVTTSRLQAARRSGKGPPYAKIGRLVRYNPHKVDIWAERRA